jgi:hypothetical protein
MERCAISCIAAQFVWDTVQQDLPPLKIIIEQELVQHLEACRR